MLIPPTYAFSDIVGCFTHPLIGDIVFGGEMGVGEISIEPAVDHTDQKIASDGAVMVSYKPGQNGTISIKVQQVSEMHDQLLNWYNAVVSAVRLGNKEVFAMGVCTFRSIIDGRTHTATGVSPGKMPTFTYGETGTDWTWTLPAAQLINE